MKLRGCDVEAVATMLPFFSDLEELSLADLVVECETILSAMKSLTNIKKLNLSDMSVGNMDYEKLFSAIKLLNHLRKLNFGGVKLRDPKAFFDMLSSLSNLEEIVVS